jgi:hypothetical protein
MDSHEGTFTTPSHMLDASAAYLHLHRACCWIHHAPQHTHTCFKPNIADRDGQTPDKPLTTPPPQTHIHCVNTQIDLPLTSSQGLQLLPPPCLTQKRWMLAPIPTPPDPLSFHVCSSLSSSQGLQLDPPCPAAHPLILTSLPHAPNPCRNTHT